jgi:ABC-2 type transport system permease protein
MTFTKYLAFARIAARRQLADPADLYGRAVLFAVILGVFSSLWRAVDETGSLASDPDTLVWYLAVTEWILLSAPQLHTEIAEDVRRGDVAVHLPRPVSYLGATLARGLGALAVRLPLLAFAAAACAFALTDDVPSSSALLRAFLFGVCASAVLTTSYVALGLLSFWLTDVTPIYWVWQKLLFVLGGLMLPLTFYPTWFRALAWWTPFPVLLGGPASFLLQAPLESAGWLAAELALWGASIVLVSTALFRRALVTLFVNGG